MAISSVCFKFEFTQQVFGIYTARGFKKFRLFVFRYLAGHQKYFILYKKQKINNNSIPLLINELPIFEFNFSNHKYFKNEI
ncbi:MAG TPA: hypothetical protein DEH15_17760 [Marinilabiliales bacterium]|nr:hypothetical protein [Marinilabiliales bacterium]